MQQTLANPSNAQAIEAFTQAMTHEDIDSVMNLWACPGLTDTFVRPSTQRRAGIRSLPD
jgi:limonene-1,2-epoxide hydrolase